MSLLPTRFSHAASDMGCPEVGGSVSSATYEGLSTFAPHHTSMQCTSDECVAARDVYCALQAHFRQILPGGQIWLNEAARRCAERTHDRILRAFGTTHRERRPLYCAIQASIAAHTNGDYSHDGVAADFVVRLFNLIQPAPTGCGERIKAAFPQTEAVQHALAESWGICLTDPRPCQPALPPRHREP